MEENTPFDILRRLLLWTLICSVSAAPSFLWAMGEFDVAAMITGVGLFILMMTAATSTPRFLAFRKRPFVRKTLYIGYGTRVMMSVAFPVGMATDLFPGMLSIAAVQTLGLNQHEFKGTLIITLVQGTCLNTLVMIYMVLVYGILAATGTPPIEGLACPKCGYDLRGSLDSVTCPECGGDVIDQVRRAKWQARREAQAAAAETHGGAT